MPVLEWDKVGDRTYQGGVDRGALYLGDGTVVPWNGLTGVEDATNIEVKSYYLDGVKILDHVTPGEFVGKLSAFTYPEEFEAVMGVVAVDTGLYFHEQPAKRFNLSYRTKISNDVDSDYGYKLHLLYNLTAQPDSHKYSTISPQGNIDEFTWSLTGMPTISAIDGIRPTVHVSIDSTSARPDILQQIEDILYGTDTTEPRWPSILEIRIIFGEVGGLYIIDNGDGTWTALDPSDDFISMLDPETFQIEHADAVVVGPGPGSEEPFNIDRYQITDTPFPIVP